MLCHQHNLVFLKNNNNVCFRFFVGPLDFFGFCRGRSEPSISSTTSSFFYTTLLKIFDIS